MSVALKLKLSSNLWMDIFKTEPPYSPAQFFSRYVFLIVASGNVWRRRRRETLAWNGCKKFSTDARVWLKGRWTDLRGGKPCHPLIFPLFYPPSLPLFFIFVERHGGGNTRSTNWLHSMNVPDESKYKKVQKRRWLLMDSFLESRPWFFEKGKRLFEYSALFKNERRYLYCYRIVVKCKL